MASSALQVGNDIAATMTAVSKALNAATKEALRAAGKVARAEIEAEGRKRTGDLRLSNMRGARIGVRSRVSADVVTVTPAGPWGILEPGARPHEIGVKGRPLKIGGRWVRGPVRHPGTGNTRAWSIGQARTFEIVERELPKTVGRRVGEAFSG